MLATYYTWRALAREWNASWAGAGISDVFTQQKGELVLVFEAAGEEFSLRVSVVAPLRYAIRAAGRHRARKNAVSLFEAAVGLQLQSVRVAERDRFLIFSLSNGLSLQILLFGPRPNVLLVGESGLIVHAFKGEDRLAGTVAPTPRPAVMPRTPEEFRRAWRADRPELARALSATLPLFDDLLAQETVFRAGLESLDPSALNQDELDRLFAAYQALLPELDAPHPRVYQSAGHVEAFSLIALRHRRGASAKPFETVTEAAEHFTRRRLAGLQFETIAGPLSRALEAAAARVETSLEAMAAELASPSRAERYEQWGHLLMASLRQLEPGQEEAMLADIFADGAETRIPLDPALTAVENAQHYYGRARRAREARSHGVTRLDAMLAESEQLWSLLRQLRSLRTAREVETFKREYAGLLSRYVGRGRGDASGVPFRRLIVDGNLEVWVGRNAAQNDLLTSRYARKFDLWFHARGAAGSHVVLRLPGARFQPSRKAIEQAAAIAAQFSEAKHSGLVPVQMAERKYVRKPKGASPGAVVVEREEVLLVAPGLPAG